MFSTMLVPLDGSPGAEAALGYAALLPSERVRLLRVAPDAGAAAEDGELGSAGRAAVEAEARAYLDRAGETLRRQGREVASVILWGDPAEQILGSAADVDLIVMTTRGLGSGARIVFGSVADRVARHAAAPTLVIRPEGRPSGPPRVARIVVPLDGSERAARALVPAAETAALLGVPVHLVRVIEADPVRAAVQAGQRAAAAYAQTREAERQEAGRDLAEQAQALRAQNLKTTTELRDGQPAIELLDMIAATDLVVMTTHGRGGVRRWLLGSVADKLVHEALAPVLLIRPDRSQDAESTPASASS